MERRLKEEQITKKIISWLEINGWNIICFDFPQSGTGIVLHPNVRIAGSKNKNTIIPDIIAVKNSVAVFFENKDRFCINDFRKLSDIREFNTHSDSINKILMEFSYKHIYYGVGLPISASEKANLNKNMVDFIITTDTKSIFVLHQIENIFLT